MNQYTPDKAEKSGSNRQLSSYFIEIPENKNVTVVDHAVVLLSRVSMLLILVGVAITFFEVVMRYAFNSPTTWAYKNTLWLGAIVYLISGAYAMQRRNHIRITAFYKIAPDWLALTFDYLSLFVIVVYATLMVVGGTEPAYDAFLTWIRSSRLVDPSMSGTIKPLILIMTVVVAIVAINNMLIDRCGSGKKHKTRANKDDS